MVIKMNKILNFKGDHEGLDSQTAKENLRVYGFNSEIKQEEKRKFKFYGVFKNLRIYLMLSAAALYFVSGFSAEGGLLLFLALGFCTFEILVENYCTQKLSEITDSAVVITRVVRDGEIALVKREEIVQDDLIVLQGGENVPADAHILESSNVTVDESVFGGSANPVKKHPGSDGRHELKQSCVYKGTKVLTGVLIARVFATGQDVKLRPEIRTVKEINRTQIETTVNKLSVLFTYGAGILLVVVAVARFMMAGNAEPEEGITVLGYLAGIILPAISFTLCAVPVSLALIIRIYYVNGATKLSEDYSGIKSLRTVETLKAVTAVCLDIDSIIVADDTPIVEEISKNKEMLIRVAALSCKTDEPVPSNSYEKAILVGASFRHINTDELYKNTLLRPYVPELESDYNKINGNLWEINGAHLLCVKGTPEVILSFCKLPPEQLYPIQQKQSEYAKQGYHVFAVAFAKIEDDCYEEDDEDGNGDESETAKSLIPDTLFDVEYTFLGLIVFSATIRENIPEVVKSCYSVGINVVMLSPDSERSGGRETALTIARKAGISQDGVIAGKKEEVVESLKSAGEVVALFGTSSNDIKALEAADISVALSKYTTPRDWDSGAGGLSELTTGSACEACELVLKSSNRAASGNESANIAKIVSAFNESRQIHRNIKRCISVAVSTFTAVFLFGLLNLFVGDFYIPDAMLVSVLAVIIIPLLCLFFVKNEYDTDNSEIDNDEDSIGGIGNRLLLGAAFQGGSLFAALLIMFLVFSAVEGYTAEMLRAIFLAVFTAGGIATAWVNSSLEKPFYKSFAESFANIKELKSKPTLIITGELVLILPLLIYLPYINAAFGLEAISPLVFALSLLIGMASQLWFEFIKKNY